MTDPITVVVADDHPVVLRGITALLAAEPDIEVVAQVTDGQEAVDAALRLRPRVIVMDLRMPVLDGADATATLKERWPDAPVIVLTTYGSDEEIVRALDAGASGYLLKDAPPDDLVDAVRRAAAGETVLGAPVAKRLVERSVATTSTALTSREIEILREVANGNTNAEVAERLHISQATVKTHLLHIYGKLGVADRAAAVARGFETGSLSL